MADPRLSSPRLEAGTLLAGRFTIERFVRAGAMGEVYLASDRQLEERLALKLLRPAELEDHRDLERFRREVQLARRVAHPNVCRVYDLLFHPGPEPPASWLLSMEWVEGESLASRLERAGPIPHGELLPLALQLRSALSAAHQAGVIHRDFKAGNILISGEPGAERVVVCDFGLARLVAGAASLTTSGELVGSPATMSPEQVLGVEITPATDLYALGVVLYEALTGALPFRGDSALQTALLRLTQEPPSPRLLVSSLPEAWERLVLALLERDPQARQERAAAAWAELAPVAAVGPPQPVAPPPPAASNSPPKRTSRRPRVPNLAGAGALVLVMALILAGLSYSVRREPWSRARKAVEQAVSSGRWLEAKAVTAPFFEQSQSRGDATTLAWAGRLHGRVLLELKDAGAAAAALRVAKQQAALANDPAALAEAGRLLGQARGRLDEPDAARAELVEARNLFRQQLDRAGEAYTVSDLAWLELRRADEASAALLYAESRALMAAARDRGGLARVASAQGSLAERQKQLEPASRFYAEAAALFAEVGDRLGRARAQHAQARCLAALELPEQARPLAEEALQVFRRLEARGDAGRAAAALAGYNRDRGEMAPAMALYEEAAQHYRAAAEPRGVASASHDLALLARRQGQLWRARSLWQEAAALYQEQKVRVGQAAARAGLGRLAWRLGRFDEARLELGRAIALNEEMVDRRGVALSKLTLATVEIDAGRLAEARALLEPALAELATIPSEQPRAWLAEADLKALLGDLPTAIRLAERVIATRRELGQGLEAAAAELALVRLLLFAGELERTQSLVAGALPVVAAQKALEEEAQAVDTLARSALANGRPEEALSTLTAFSPRLEGGEDLRLRLAHQMLLARAAAACSKQGSCDALTAVIAEAETAGFIRLGLDGRRLLVEALAAYGLDDAARRELCERTERFGLTLYAHASCSEADG